jgi:hypothetical protein
MHVELWLNLNRCGTLRVSENRPKYYPPLIRECAAWPPLPVERYTECRLTEASALPTTLA